MNTFVNAVSTANSLQAQIQRHKPGHAVGVATATTDNGALTFASTGSKSVDFFNIIGASRGAPGNAVAAFKVAFAENPKLAAQILLYARDFRGSGLGERLVFRKILEAMEADLNFRPYLSRIIPYIPEIGRWDDLLIFKTPEIKAFAFEIIREGLWNNNGLCAKWMPRQGQLAVELRKFMSMTPKTWRKTLVDLTKCVEQQMCSGRWDQINFSHVPSRASKLYQKAFGRHAPERYAEYIKEITKPQAERIDPKVKINTATLYPYDVLLALRQGNAAVAEAQWKELPNYLENKPVRLLPIVDTSQSMDQPIMAGSNLIKMDVAASIGVYIADKNVGALQGMAFTFENKPKAIILNGETLVDRIAQLLDQRKAENTDLQATFDLLLKVAVENEVPAEDMPEVLMILSDMQFDNCTEGTLGMYEYDIFTREFKAIRREVTNMAAIWAKYSEAGYAMPRIVFWNITGKADTRAPIEFREDGTAIVSGFSPAVLKAVLSMNIDRFTPESVMLEAIDTDRYRIFENL